jgi:spermidine synthase
MGAGTLAAYAQPGQAVRFYEINPEVVRVADAQFSFLRRARERGATVEVALGDARQVLERELAERSQQFDLLVLDAFSGDSIPNHLLTKEAFDLYLRHLSDDGAIAAHVTNQYLDVPRVVLGIAETLGLEPICVETSVYASRAMAHSEWMVLTCDASLRESLRKVAMPVKRDDDRPLPLWTDDHHDMLSILR